MKLNIPKQENRNTKPPQKSDKKLTVQNYHPADIGNNRKNSAIATIKNSVRSKDG